MPLNMANILLCSFAALLLAFFRCYLVFALGQAFDSFLRLVFLNDSLLFFPLFLVPPAAKEGKGDCEFPLCPPWILLLPLCNAGHCVPGGGYGIGLLSLMPFITGGRFYGTWLIWWRCSLAQTILLLRWSADAQLLLANIGERSFLAAYSSGFVLSRGR